MKEILYSKAVSSLFVITMILLIVFALSLLKNELPKLIVSAYNASANITVKSSADIILYFILAPFNNK